MSNRGQESPQRLRVHVAAASVIAGLGILAALPVAGVGSGVGDLTRIVTGTVEGVQNVAPVVAETQAEIERRELEVARQAAEDPKTQPPLHGTNPHGQGTVGVVDIAPAPDRPTGSDPAGSDTGEEIVVGRAKGEQNEDGTYNGHITIAALFGNEILGVDTGPGETESGPLAAIQDGILTPLCDGSGNQICIEAARADSSTTDSGSTNSFSAAHATLGGPEGIDVGAAESNGNISDDGRCQNAHGDSSVANASVGGQAVAGVAQSSTDSRACKGEAPTQTNQSSVLSLGGTGVPIPDPGCADGTPDTVTGVPTIAPVVCNADDTNGTQAAAPYGARDALDVFALDAGGNQLSKASTAASESRAQAPPPQCSDREDNDGDGVIDAQDPGCLSGPGGAYNPNDDDETDQPGTTECSDIVDNDGDGVADAADPGCLSGPGGAYNPADDDERDAGTRGGGGGGGGGGDPECSDGRDNDGDGVADRNDPGCLSGPGGSFNPDDDDESNGGGTDLAACEDGIDNDGDGVADRDDPGCLSGPGGAYNPNDDDESDRRVEAGAAALPRTGTEVLLTLMGGLLALGGGMALRRRVRPEDQV